MTRGSTPRNEFKERLTEGESESDEMQIKNSLDQQYCNQNY